jgi:hypothetical protein
MFINQARQVLPLEKCMQNEFFMLFRLASSVLRAKKATMTLLANHARELATLTESLSSEYMDEEKCVMANRDGPEVESG